MREWSVELSENDVCVALHRAALAKLGPAALPDAVYDTEYTVVLQNSGYRAHFVLRLASADNVVQLDLARARKERTNG